MSEMEVKFYCSICLAKALSFYENIFNTTEIERIINMMLCFNFPEIYDELRKNKDEYEEVSSATIGNKISNKKNKWGICMFVMMLKMF